MLSAVLTKSNKKVVSLLINSKRQTIFILLKMSSIFYKTILASPTVQSADRLRC